MKKVVDSLIASGLVTILLCSCSPTSDSVSDDAAKAKSNREPIAAGQLTDSQIVFQFAIYYLPSPAKEPLGELDMLLKSKFAGFVKADKTAPPKTGKVIAARVLTSVKKDYAPPSLESLQHFGRGLSREQAEKVQGCTSALLLDFAYPREHAMDGMRAALQLASNLARSTNGLLWDEETREMFTPDEWDKRRVADWTEKTPDISKHTVIHAYNTGEYVRAITLGMAKFGLPDIVVDNFSWSNNRSMGHIVNLLGQSLAEGATITRDGEFDLDIRAIQNPKVREPQLKTLKSHATSVALLSLKKGVREEGDPKNRLIEITFERYPGPDVHSRQENMLCGLFGCSGKAVV